MTPQQIFSQQMEEKVDGLIAQVNLIVKKLELPQECEDSQGVKLKVNDYLQLPCLTCGVQGHLLKKVLLVGYKAVLLSMTDDENIVDNWWHELTIQKRKWQVFKKDE